MRRKPGVEERIQQLMAENAQRAQMSRDELMAFYAACVRTPADRVPPGSPVIQAYEETPEGGRKIRIVDKAAAGAALARMCGWNEEKERVPPGNTLMIYLTELRAQRLEPSAFRVGAGGSAPPILEIEPAAPPAQNGENGGVPRSDAAA